MSSEELSALAESLGSPPPRKPARLGRVWKPLLVVGGGILLFAAGLGVGALVFNSSDAAGAEQGKSKLVLATDKCSVASVDARIGDGGNSLTLNGGGKEDSGLAYTDIVCILNELGTPDHVLSEMDSTRALDGKQSAQWGEVRASWTYHPDQGLDLILVLN
ncbi:hypothetical protein ACQP1S_24395 [Micromonospora matsumotoense]|uniref:hypothetical protein n=1 Tax=Micromonospora matsumotoense TaxID=121616 RepID=UPI003D8E18AD